MVKMDGHTGSFFPQFSWRWSKQPATEIPEMTGKMAEEGTVIETEGLGELSPSSGFGNEELGV